MEQALPSAGEINIRGFAGGGRIFGGSIGGAGFAPSFGPSGIRSSGFNFIEWITKEAQGLPANSKTVYTFQNKNGWIHYNSIIHDSYDKKYAESIGTPYYATVLFGKIRANDGGFGQAQGGGGSLFGDILTGTEKHFNGGLGTLGVAVQGYNNIGNDVKRAYAYKLSKMTGLKSGQIFQGAKGFANSTGKLVSKLGPVGTLLGVGVIGYEVGTDTWDAHTLVNGSLMIGVGVATVFAAPGVLTGIAIYGVGDYFFDFGGTIDRNVGRNSGVWRP